MNGGQTESHRITLRGGDGVYLEINAMFSHPLMPDERLKE